MRKSIGHPYYFPSVSINIVSFGWFDDFLCEVCALRHLAKGRETDIESERKYSKHIMQRTICHRRINPHKNGKIYTQNDYYAWPGVLFVVFSWSMNRIRRMTRSDFLVPWIFAIVCETRNCECIKKVTQKKRKPNAIVHSNHSNHSNSCHSIGSYEMICWCIPLQSVRNGYRYVNRVYASFKIWRRISQKSPHLSNI